MFEMLMELPGGQAFRGAVLEQGREFTRFEFLVVDACHCAWERERKAREAIGAKNGFSAPENLAGVASDPNGERS